MEPSLDQIEDYNDHESPKKRKTVLIVIIGLILLGIIFDTIISESYQQKPEIYVPKEK